MSIEERMKVSLYVIVTPWGRLIAEMNESQESNSVFGAVMPELDGNYYKEIVVSGIREERKYILGVEGWLRYLTEEAIPQKRIKISEDFPFDPRTLKIIELKEVD